VYAGFGFRCVPAGADKRHMVKRSTLPRSMAISTQVSNGDEPVALCTKCGGRHAADSGVLLAAGYTYAMIEQAEAMVRFGRGGTFADVGWSTRMGANRTRQPARTKCLGRPWLPRDVYPKQPRTTKPMDYDYRTPRPKSLLGSFSRSATTVASYLDVFAPCIVAEFSAKTMPRILALDSKPLKRRAWKADASGAVNQVSAGERNGEVMVIAQASDDGSEAFPILAALEGGPDSESWIRVFARLPDGPKPVWVVADIDAGIKIAVEKTWPGTTLFRCERHLIERMAKALVLDGIPRQVTPEQAESLGVKHKPVDPVRAVRRGYVPKKSHPLHSLVRRSLTSRPDWEAMKVGIEGLAPGGTAKLLPDEMTGLRAWISDNEALVLSQFDLKAKFPNMPKSAGGVEETLTRIGAAIGKRSEFFSNARRLELIIGLIRIEALGLANVDRYSEIIKDMIASRDGAGMDWQAGRDILGTSSIDQLIDSAVTIAAVAEADRKVLARQAQQDKRTAKIDAERAAAGLPPTHTGRFRRSTGPATYHPIVKGQTVADIPGIGHRWWPEHNSGRRADEVLTGSGDVGMWACEEHGHLHLWPRKIIDMCTQRPSCPFCSGNRVCASNSLLALHPDLAKEWATSNLQSPAETPDGSSNDAMWICMKGHDDFPQRINARTRQHQICPKCNDEKMAATVRGPMSATKAAAQRKERERKKGLRKIAAAARPVTLPPVVLDFTPNPHEESLSIAEVSALFGPTRETIANWVKGKRLGAVRIGTSKNAAYRVPVSEVARVAAILGLPALGTEVIAVSNWVHVGDDGLVTTDSAPPGIPELLEGETDDTTWFVPPEQRYGKPPAA
jgi:hypothetical protein